MTRKISNATRRERSEAAAARAAQVREEQERLERRRRSIVVAVVGLVVVAVLIGIGALVQAARDSSGETATPPRGAVETYAIPAGSSSAPVTVDVYEDFLCPFCGQFEARVRKDLRPAIEDGSVQFRYHVINLLDDASTTDYSLRAANAQAVVLDTAGPDVAERFHDLLFENQPEEGGPGLSDARLVDLAVQAGAERDAVRTGVEQRSFEQWVENATDQASKDGVQGTPTVRIDGETVTFATIDELVGTVQAAVDAGRG